jgi:hypothetical protein
MSRGVRWVGRVTKLFDAMRDMRSDNMVELVVLLHRRPNDLFLSGCLEVRPKINKLLHECSKKNYIFQI